MKKFSGAITALATPFKNGSVDNASVKKLVHLQLENGIEGLVVNGTTAESPTLEWGEVKALFELVRSEVSGQVPILVGTGSHSTKKTIEASLDAQSWGADGLLIVTPYYNKPPQRGLVAHYKAVAEKTRTPIMLYNVPGRTGVSLSEEATKELSNVSPIAGIKDATADLELGKKIVTGCGPNFTLSSGDDFTFVPLALEGATGVISVLSNIAPKAVRTLLDLARAGDQSSLQKYEPWRKLTELLFVEANPIPVKWALYRMGIFETKDMRLPLVPLAENLRKALEDELFKTGLIT